ncbi:hypothetical protein CAOG_07157 [Capsaspora owczarzaki ATCC 30864]|uniref:Ras GTPase-activating protein 3 n=1 Tax=Capsaspora owczarzaki (strain ATCC 30864) TaxID=595528 RepID=A0A0D2X4Z3_CAPO3|nr:hypothetical protein CAOG_07157 [Capsaspora owczarzaki ATCC 30864]KJE96909.1 hypothetical protein CAOG_007157 [Capsaspora owczarzaki ATCC 30864]|eukprot:XP_004343881.2 hypothetical protein CAOG_07157 [Capsaspora owczarzaki ATCC 30864]
MARRFNKEASVHLRIGEGKNLGERFGSPKVDPYCIIKVNHEEVVRTATAWKTQFPFWGEEYDVSLPLDWKELSIYCLDQTTFDSKGTVVLGKITLNRKNLLSVRGHTIEQWYPLSPADRVDDVRGELYLDLRLHHRGFVSDRTKGKSRESPYEVVVTVVEARGLPSRDDDKRAASGNHAASSVANGRVLANPCVRMCVQVEGETSLVEQTSTVCLNTLCPNWNSSYFTFELAENDFGSWDDSATLFVTMVDVMDDGQERFLGEVTIPLIELDLDRSVGAWYSLFPRQDAVSMAVTAAATASALDGAGVGLAISPTSAPRPFTFSTTAEPSTRASISLSGDYRTSIIQRTESSGQTSQSSVAKMGAIRLKIKYEEDDVLPISHYDPLLKLLLGSLNGPEALTTGAIALLEDVMSDREDVARALIKIFLDQELVTPLLNALASREIKSIVQPTTLFRGSSLASKSVEQFLKMTAMQYLNTTLKGVVDSIFAEKLSCEIDPNKLPKGQDASTNASQIERNSANLRLYSSRLLDAISSSVDACPLAVRQVFKYLQERVLERFSDDKAYLHLRYVVVSGFLFLRFFSPALLAPKTYGLSDEHPDAATARTLTLVAKILQNLGNLGQRAGNKEQYMSAVDTFIVENVARVRSFIDHLTAVSGAIEFTNQAANHRLRNESSKEGELFKLVRKNGVEVGAKPTFVRRSFQIDDRAVSYFDDGEIAGRIRAEDVVAIEKVDQAAFNRPHMIQMISSNRRHADQILYVAASDVNEQNEWLSAFRNFAGRNPNARQHYHPGGYRGNRWTCCKLTDSAAEGCNMTHPIAASMDLRTSSVSRELHRLYRQFALGLPKLVSSYLNNSKLVTAVVTAASMNGGTLTAAAAAAAAIEAAQDRVSQRKAYTVRQLEVVVDDIAQYTGVV